MKVYAKSEDVKKYLLHPTTKVRFKEDGSAEWPADQFTFRRIRDGDVLAEPPPGGLAPSTVEIPPAPEGMVASAPAPTRTRRGGSSE